MPAESSKLARLVYLLVCIIISHGFTITHHFLNKSIYIFHLGEGGIVWGYTGLIVLLILVLILIILLYCFVQKSSVSGTH